MKNSIIHKLKQHVCGEEKKYSMIIKQHIHVNFKIVQININNTQMFIIGLNVILL